MIYDLVANEDPIRQGDIFRDIPRIDFSLHQVIVAEAGEEQPRVLSWRDLLEERPVEVSALLPVKRVTGIVITQNCDAVRGEFLSLCQTGPYLTSIAQGEPTSVNKWVALVTRHSRENLRFFYLPADERIGFSDRMAVDFRIVLSVKRQELESMKELRIGRLNEIAYEHFRETLGQFFRRYAYNEWYPFTREEFQIYAQKYPGSAPYEWQR